MALPFSLTRLAWIVPFTRPPMINSAATMSPSTFAPSSIRTVEAWSSPSMRPQILTVPVPLILPTIVVLELIEEIASADSEASEAATGVRCNCCTGEGARSFSVGLSLGFPNISWSFLGRCRSRSNLSDGVVNAVETAPEMAEHFAACRSNRRRDIVYTDLPSNQRHHLAVPRGPGIGQIADIARA